MKIKKRITVEIQVDDLNHKHCAHTNTAFVWIECKKGYDNDGVISCKLFNRTLKKNHREYPIRCPECIKKFGPR